MRSYDFLAATLKRLNKLPVALSAYAEPQNLAMRRELVALAKAATANM